ncbi:hypothetical protein NESM_000564900 [Novymonas esmeraldas]|uniref:Uncharacterized protein n=1 Tax=Novymonas esmeraldas TaxID=1808958 RepID=A0AAW0EQ24_9TRYP
MLSQESRSDFSLPRYSTGDALHFVFENGACRQGSTEMLTTLLPGLGKVVELQEKQAMRDGIHQSASIDDPLHLEEVTRVRTHEQWCAHSQTACALAKNAVTQGLRRRIELRVRRYGEAVVRLAEESSSVPDTDDEAVQATVDSLSASAGRQSTSSRVSSISSEQCRPSSSLATESSPETETDLGGADETDSAAAAEDEEELEAHLRQHIIFGHEKATGWLRRRYTRCCDVMGVSPSSIVRQRLSRCVRATASGTLGAFFAAHMMASPLSPVPEVPATLASTSAGQSWLSFPSTTALLRERCTVPYEVSVNLSGCSEIGQRRRHFIAVLGVLEGCGNTVVALRMAKTSLTDDEVRVLCLFCRAHLRRLRVLDLSGNNEVTDKVSVWLKQLAASSPLLCQLSLRGTALSRSTVRTVTGLLCRKIK